MTANGKRRADVLLTESGLCPSRTKAKELIEKSLVSFISGANSTLVQSPSQEFDLSAGRFQIDDPEFLKFVSRSGHKLAGALDFVQLDVSNFKCLDIGASTGGFTDCLLQRGASESVCVDVGQGQLHPKVAGDSRVKNLEGLNAKDLINDERVPQNYFNLIVMDVSFISATKVLPAVLDKLRDLGFLIALIKPQFEVGSVNIGKGGIVNSQQAVDKVLEDFHSWARSFRHPRLDLRKHQIFPSELKGRDGNQEYFLFVSFGEES